MNKPIMVQINETTQKLVDDINASGLHPYILVNILKELYDETRLLLENTTKQETDEYNKRVEFEKQSSDSNDDESQK